MQGYSFQIGYCETDDQLPGRSLPQYTLYLVASNEKERSEWIAAIRDGKTSFFTYNLILFNSLYARSSNVNLKNKKKFNNDRV